MSIIGRQKHHQPENLIGESGHDVPIQVNPVPHRTAIFKAIREVFGGDIDGRTLYFDRRRSFERADFEGAKKYRGESAHSMISLVINKCRRAFVSDGFVLDKTTGTFILIRAFVKSVPKRVLLTRSDVEEAFSTSLSATHERLNSLSQEVEELKRRYGPLNTGYSDPHFFYISAPAEETITSSSQPNPAPSSDSSLQDISTECLLDGASNVLLIVPATH